MIKYAWFICLMPDEEICCRSHLFLSNPKCGAEIRMSRGVSPFEWQELVTERSFLQPPSVHSKRLPVREVCSGMCSHLSPWRSTRLQKELGRTYLLQGRESEEVKKRAAITRKTDPFSASRWRLPEHHFWTTRQSQRSTDATIAYWFDIGQKASTVIMYKKSKWTYGWIHEERIQNQTEIEMIFNLFKFQEHPRYKNSKRHILICNQAFAWTKVASAQKVWLTEENLIPTQHLQNF